MSQLDREGLISQSNALFPDNTAQEITPTDIRQFDLDVIDSFALTGSLVVSASYAVSASQAENANTSISASHAVNADTVGLFNKTIIDGTEFQVLRTDGAGNLSFDYSDRTQSEIRTTEAITKGDPLYVVGFNVGQNRIEVGIADASDPSKMPSFGLAYETVGNNQNSQMVNLGSLDDIDTQVTYDFQVGDTVYVAVGGGLTNVKPTGTNLIQNVGVVGRRGQNNGEILVSAIGRSNDLPNIQNGYLWVGDTNGVPQAVASSSIQTDTSNLATTGSNTFNGSQIISGSLNVQDTNAPMTGISLTNASGGGKVQILPAGDFVTTFNSATLTGITNYGGNTLSGSWGEVGDIGGSGIGIQNALLDGGNQGIYLSHGNYDAWVSAPNGTTAIKGDTITLTPSSSAVTSVQLTGDVTASGTISYGTSVLNNSSNIISGSTTLQDTSMAPASTFVVNDGNQVALTVNNSALAGIVGASVNVQGNSVFSGNQTVTGTQVISDKLEVTGSTGTAVNIKDAQAGPATTFAVNDGSQQALSVVNATLAGIVGTSVTVQGNSSFSGNQTVTGKQVISDGLEVTGSTFIGGVNSDVTISAGTSGRTLLLSGSNVTLESGTPMNINSAVTFNGAMLVNAAIYQGQDDLAYPSASISNLYDYFFVPLTPFTTAVNVDSFIGQGRTVNLLVQQTSGTGLIELQYSGGPTGTTQLFGPAAAVSGSYLTPSTTPGSYTSFELKAYDIGGVPSNIIAVTSYEPNLVIGDITKWQ